MAFEVVYMELQPEEEKPVVPTPGEEYAGEVAHFFASLPVEFATPLLKYFLDEVKFQGQTWYWKLRVSDIPIFHQQEMPDVLNEWFHSWNHVLHSCPSGDFVQAPFTVIVKTGNSYFLTIEDPHQVLEHEAVLFSNEITPKETLFFLNMVAEQSLLTPDEFPTR